MLHHLALGARDVERVAEFYASCFGLDVVSRHDYEGGELRSIWLGLGQGILMIEHADRTRERCEGVDAGLFLISFRVASQEERERIEALLESRGSSIEERTAYSSYARDPEGNRFAISLDLPDSLFHGT